MHFPLVFSSILKFIRPCPNKVCNVHNPAGSKLLRRLRLELSHLRAHKFSHNFSDFLDKLFAELISNLRTISSSNVRYIYPKNKPLWRKSVMLRFQFLIKTKNALLFDSDKLSNVKTFSYSVQQLNTFYRQKGLTFLFE